MTVLGGDVNRLADRRGKTHQPPRRVWIGDVVSNKMDKTVTVTVARRVRHPKYGKVMTRLTKLKAHDPRNVCRIGDRVKLVGTRPLSKTKHWLVVEILRSTEDASPVREGG